MNCVKFYENEHLRRNMILYNCPDLHTKSSGINRIYRHVDYLVRNGFRAAVLHSNSSFVRKDHEKTPRKYLDMDGDLKEGDVVVMPEMQIEIMKQMSLVTVRRMVFCLNWAYAFKALPLNETYRTYGIERMIVSCSFIGDMVGWAMGLPAHLVANSIDSNIYFPEFELPQKKKKIVFIERKGALIPMLMRVLQARNPRFISEIEWFALDGLDEQEYARHIREASVFVNASTEEGILNASFQAMRCNTLLAGFDSIGGQGTICADGDEQNYIVAQNGDYLSLAWLMEPLLEDLLASNLDKWERQKNNAFNLISEMTVEKEEESVISLWKRLAPDCMI